MKKIGKVREIQVEVKPDLVFYDEINQIPLIIGWNLEHDDCPFLTCENKCGIYEERPLICQAFPLFSSGLLEESDIKSYLGDCPNAINPFKDGQMARRREFVKTMYKLYGNTWIASARRDFAIKWLYDLIVSAEGQKTIRRAKLNKKVIKALLREKPIGLLTFLLSKGTIKEEEITEKIKGINSPINENDIYMLLQD